MKQALVIHPKLSILAGGEFICLNVIEACRKNGWKVTLLSDHVDLVKLDRIYGMGQLLKQIEWITLPEFKPVFSRFRALQAIMYGRQFKRFVQKIVQERDVQIIFSTQSSIFGLDQIPSYHFCYGDPKDLFVYPFAYYRKKNRWLYDMTIRGLVRLFIGSKPVPTAVFVNSRLVSDNLEREGFKAFSYIPPIQPIFKPKPKKQQVVMVSRFDRGKRLEWFLEIARQLPEYKFILICRRDGEIERLFAPGYSEEILSELPPNLEFVGSPVRSVAWIVEESKAYIYTGNEAGIALVMNEGIAAGCIPLAPKGTGNAEIIDTLGIGFTYSTPEQGAKRLRQAMESDIDPQEISRLATRFSPEAFQDQIKQDCNL